MTGSDGTIEITSALVIPWRELAFHATAAGGAGGQHVNRTATRVELRWNVAESPSLTDAQRAMLLTRLKKRLDRTGRIRVVSDSRRSQRLNKDAAVERFVKLVAAALHVARPRRATRPTRASVERRLDTKKRRAGTKAARKSVSPEE
ncbi:MAG TPA: alternative ribosome rescue aminoacyl-tRNA hydrolase ArfB [Gemmatimonadales bacterium]|nr:alternative ribosome rescue aminoacyl-tRNA hydrolase ArfB [Gemmatimonadales bacterium]